MTADLDSIENKLRTALREAATDVRATPGAWNPRPSPRRHRPRTRLVAVAAIAVIAVGTAVVIVASNQGRSPTIQTPSKGPHEVAPDALPSSRADLEVFMNVDASDTEIAAVRRGIASSDAVRRYAYVDKQAALAQFRRIFARNPDLVRNITVSAVPTSFRLVLQPHTPKSAIRHLFERRPGVDAVTTPNTNPVRRDDGVHDHASIEIFMTVDATDAQTQAVRDLLKHLPEVTGFKFYDKAASLARFRRAYRDEPNVLQNVTANALPTSFRIVERAHASVQQIRSTLQGLAGVNTVQILSG